MKSHAALRQGLLSCTSSSEIWSCSLLHTSSSLKGFPITQNSLAWSTLAPWLIKSLWNRLCYNTSMLPRARGRSGGRLACIINSGCPAKQQEEQRSSKGQSRMGSGSAGSTNDNSRVTVRPETQPNCCSTHLAPGTRGQDIAHLEGEASWSIAPVRAWKAAEWDACWQKAQPERWHPAFLLFQPPLCHQPCCLQVLGAETEKGTYFDRCVADFRHDWLV